MNIKKEGNETWSQSSYEVFWGELAPYDHVVQIYENEDNFLELLAGFVDSGIACGDCTILIATRSHIEALERRLEILGHSVADLKSSRLYVPLDALELLRQFMINDWPDENLFKTEVDKLIRIAKEDGRRVRAFGEMVALLWAEGKIGATVRLEQLWNRFCENEAFCLFCAYPERGFTEDASASLMHICSAHAKVISGTHNETKQIFYKSEHQKVG
jgi:hypothetical protein